jgi:hypothetical protein
MLLSCRDEAMALHSSVTKLNRWTRTEVLSRTPFLVLAPIIASNMIMNRVDRTDQFRGINIAQLSTIRKEIHDNVAEKKVP